MAPPPRLGILVVGGAAAYATLLWTLGRPLMRELLGSLLKRTPRPP